jgi:hypothetical protein
MDKIVWNGLIGKEIMGVKEQDGLRYYYIDNFGGGLFGKKPRYILASDIDSIMQRGS